MPELNRVKDLPREIYKDSQLKAMLKYAREAESSIRHILDINRSSERRRLPFTFDPNLPLRSARRELLARLATVKMLGGAVFDDISSVA
ncbi:hypothetical protein PHISP_03849 [Aspergillus sp. HF37]|nr:hypothetical protein PHISP_03849 [Aspergillus sp. HF37]